MFIILNGIKIKVWKKKEVFENLFEYNCNDGFLDF